MELHSLPVTPDNRAQILDLQIMPEQRGYIESVAECLAEADQNRRWRPVGLFDRETLVGFAMYGYFFWEYFPHGRLWLDRLLIDARFQGQGYGRSAVSHLLERLSREWPKKPVYLSVIHGNDRAVRLYESFDFHFTGEKDIHGEDIMVRKAESNN